ncbi:MAG: hypothetical protein JO272_18325 [Pseudonocardiales bacterium]|nr:hypothetical protein [Pseudonocardiales bacterium]
MTTTSSATSWITVNAAPMTTPFFVYRVNPRNDTTTLTYPVVCWLVQHRYRDGLPVDDRVVAGFLWSEDGRVRPADQLSGFVGVYPDGEAPGPERIEAAKLP